MKVVVIEKGREPAAINLDLLGGKAYYQALAAADNLPILKGVVLTTEVFPGFEWLNEVKSSSAPSCVTLFTLTERFTRNPTSIVPTSLPSTRCAEYLTRGF